MQLLTELILMKDSCFSLSGFKPSTAFNSEGSALRKCGNDRYNGASERKTENKFISIHYCGATSVFLFLFFHNF